ncbi:unnamed protein product, partial [Ascophyllum nodosum]
ADSSASGLFFLVVERGLDGCGVLGDSKPSSGGAKRSVDNAVVVSPSSGESLPYPWAEAGVLPEDAAATSASLLVPGNPRGGDGDDDDGSPAETSFQEDEGDGPCADAEVDGRSDDHCGHSHDRDRTEYTVPYWAIIRVGEVTRDPDDDPDPWPLLGVDVGGVGVGDRNARKKPSQVSPLPPTQHLQYPQQQSFRKPLTRAVSPSPGYSVVIINVKVSVHHPRGSAVASNKDAVIEGITKGLQARARKVNQLMLLKSLIETKVANEVLIPPDTVPAPPPPPLKDPPSIMRVSPRRSPPERPSRAATLNPRALISPNPIDTLAGGSGRLGGRSSGSGAGVSAFGPADGR